MRKTLLLPENLFRPFYMLVNPGHDPLLLARDEQSDDPDTEYDYASMKQAKAFLLFVFKPPPKYKQIALLQIC